MIILSWNCRGLGHPSAVPALRDLIRIHKPDIIFLSETICHANKIEEVRRIIHYESCFSVDREGRSGGLAMLWRHERFCEIQNYSQNFINVIVKEDDSNQEWRLTGFYGIPQRGQRRESWNILRMLSQQSNIPWCIIGDFNDILSNDDKRGDVPHPTWLFNGFRQAVSDCGLIDVPLQGHSYTWSRRIGMNYVVEERLDRALVTQPWMSLFPHCILKNLISGASDHSPLLLCTEPQTFVYKKRQFRFENTWLVEPELPSIVDDGWKRNLADPLLDRLAACTEELDNWGRALRRRYKEGINNCKKKIEELQGLNGHEADAEVITLKEKLNSLLIQEEIFWKQRAKTFWMRDGDMNSKFFHAAATSRKQRNKITKLLSDDNIEVNTQEGLCTLGVDYFSALFKATTCDVDPVLQVVHSRLTEEDNQLLIAPFNAEEFKDAVFQMNSDKAPGPDGLNPAFYKRFWSLCGSEIVNTCKKWLHDGYFPDALGDTNIVLIPKCDQPRSMKDLRPISLCNVVYKILSKALANRLQQVLNKCISIEQSGFISGRSITDNVLVASEIIHYLKCKNRGRKGEVALKIDISKAYDRVDWHYLFSIMRRMGFHQTWINWMKMCVTNVKYHILMNDDRVGPVIPERGLRQGDPLSPYLFLLCAEGMTALIKQAEQNNLLHGVKVCRRAPAVSHLLFADDSFLFFRANDTETNVLKNILDVYANASGQMINMQKSEIFFSKNVPHDLRAALSNILQVTECLGTGKYLGLPSMIGRSKKSIFNYIKDRIWHRISSWSSKMLSQAGKEVLIKSVAQAIPSYCMSVFLLPSSIGDDIEKMLNSFWWGSKGDRKHGIRWMSWDKLTMRKEFGGMGFRSILGFNLAMLGKQGWKLLTNPDAMVSRIFKAKYYPNGDFLGASLGHNPSYVWRSIWSSRPLLKEGYRWRIGNGSLIPIWRTPWLRNEDNPTIVTPILNNENLSKVSDLIDVNQGCWNRNRVSELFCDRDANEILKIPLVNLGKRDEIIWRFDKKGIYSVKSAYRVCVDVMINRDDWKVEGDWQQLWTLPIPPKVKQFMWRLGRDCLPNRQRLMSKGVHGDSNCVVCHRYTEYNWHLFLDCADSIACWRQVKLWNELQNLMENAEGFNDVFKRIWHNFTTQQLVSFAMTSWSLWRKRNLQLWEQKIESTSQVIGRANGTLQAWQHARQPTDTVQPPQQHVQVTPWQPPPTDFVKCNLDAAIFVHEQCIGMGACLRDDKGNFILAMTTHENVVMTAQEAEAWSLYQGIQWVANLGYNKVIFELDCKIVVDDVNKMSINQSEYGSIIQNCRTLLHHYNNFIVVFARRQANGSAHALARAALSHASRSTFNVIPNCIATIVMNEMP